MNSAHLGVLFILGIGVFGGILGARIFQRLQIPQVVGYIVIGLLIGESGLKMVRYNDIMLLEPLNFFALGVIGFLVGGELRIDAFRKYAKQFTAILLGEGLFAFFLVSAPTTVLLYMVLQNMALAVAGGVVFGAIASATDPASTVDVLWENRSRGILTTSIIAIVALDDALAMLLYGIGTSIAKMLTGGGGGGGAHLLRVVGELFGSLTLGVLFALLLIGLLRWISENERSTALAVGLILLLISFAVFGGLDVILATMTLGFITANAAPKRSHKLFSTIRAFSMPIYVLFFVFVGARLSFHTMPLWLLGVVVIYVVGRTAGKMLGAYMGARFTKAPPVVRKYLGLGIFAQGGVAVGLSIMAGHQLNGIRVSPELTLGDAIIFAVTVTTLLLQVLGPPLVKWAVTKAGEAGRDITDQDIIALWTVKDAMISEVPPLREDQALHNAVRALTMNDWAVYPVVDSHGHLTGTLSLAALRQVLPDPASWNWLLVADIMTPAEEVLEMDAPLENALKLLRQVDTDQLPVIRAQEDPQPVGMLDANYVRKMVIEELIHRQDPSAVEAPDPAHNTPVASHPPAHVEPSRHQRKVGELELHSVASLPCVREDENSRTLLQVMEQHADAQTLYVVNARGMLRGTVHINRLIEYIFPDEMMSQQSNEVVIAMNTQSLEKENITDLMDESPQSVHSDTLVLDAVRILLREHISELPVVTANGRFVGCVHARSLLTARLKDEGITFPQDT